MRELLGGDLYDTLDISSSHFTTLLTPVARSTNPDGYVRCRHLMGPYQKIVVLAAAPAPGAGNGFNHHALAAALQTNRDRKEATKLKVGKARMSGLHIGGVIDMKTGNIATLSL